MIVFFSPLLVDTKIHHDKHEWFTDYQRGQRKKHIIPQWREAFLTLKPEENWMPYWGFYGEEDEKLQENFKKLKKEAEAEREKVFSYSVYGTGNR